jgi:hypothetical protein
MCRSRYRSCYALEQRLAAAGVLGLCLHHNPIKSGGGDLRDGNGGEGQ